MEIYQIRAFVTVARLGHLTRAAEALHLTQPAVTAQIKALEQSLGVSLFQRSGGKLSLDKAGESLLPTAEALLKLGSELKAQATQLHGQLQGQFELGIPSERMDFLRLGPFTQAITNSLPLVHLHTRVLPAEQLSEYVSTGRLTAAFAIAAHPPRDVQWLPLRSVVYRIAVPNGLHEQLQAANWRELAALPWLDGPSGSHSHWLLRDMFEKRGQSPRIVMQIDDLANIDSLVMAKTGCALLREEVALEGFKRQAFSLWGNVRINATLGFVYPSETEAQPLLIAVISLLKQLWKIDD